MMDHRAATAFLDELTNYERLGSYRYDSKNFGVERMRRLLAALGSPHSGRSYTVVAGTKGKGSTASMLAAILSSSGRRTGLYTSPHLREYRERISIGGEPIAPAAFAALATEVEGPVRLLAGEGEDLRPTTFEALTAMALLGFSREGCDAAVLEVGMGGRLDAVNVVDPAVVCMTTVSLDHTDQLGSTVEVIAGEKAGVIKGPVPVACGPQEPAALAVLEQACRRVRATLLLSGRDFRAEEVGVSLSGATFDAVTPAGRERGLHIALRGRHQVDNAMVAVAAAQAWGLATREGVRNGLAAARWPGRMEFMTRDPRVLVDGAHNAASAEALAAAIRELLPGRKVALVLAMLKGKDIAGVLGALLPLAESVYLPGLSHPREFPAADLAAAVGDRADTRVFVNPGEALNAALAEAGPDGLVLAAGSLALAGEVLRWNASPGS